MSTTTTTTTTEYNFYIPPPSQSIQPFQPFQGNGPFGLGIFQRIGNKISNTAEFLAEMVRSTVKVITAFNRVS